MKGNGRCRDTPSVLPLRVKPPSPRGRLNSLSQSLRLCQLPLGGSLWHGGKVFGFAKGPISEGAVAVGDWGSFIPRSAALSQKAALHLPFSVTTPLVKKMNGKIRRFSRSSNIKIIIPLSMRRAKRSALKSFVPWQTHCQESTALSSTLSRTASCKAFSILRCAP